MKPVISQALPGELLARGWSAVSDLEDVIRRIDRGAHALRILGALHRPGELVDERAVTFIGEMLCDLTSALIVEWGDAVEILKPEK